jgi:uncharacterized protein YciI
MPTYLIRLRPARVNLLESGPTAAESAAISAHFAYLQSAAKGGTLWFAGRTDTTGSEAQGIAVIHAPDADAAKSFLAADPAIHAGVFQGDVLPFRVAIREDSWTVH